MRVDEGSQSQPAPTSFPANGEPHAPHSARNEHTSFDLPFHDRVALLTGGSRGIGRALTLKLAELGARVTFTYRRDEAAAQEVSETAAALPGAGSARAVRMELEQMDELAATVHDVVEREGRIDLLIASAAATAFKPAADIKPHHLARTYATVVGAFQELARLSVPHMPEGGSILAVSSIGADFCLPGYSTLGAAKASLEAWVRYLAWEYGRRGLRVNAVSPGVVDTDSWQFYTGDSHAEASANARRLSADGRLTEPDEIVDTAIFLLSPAARGITGQTIKVDHGLGLGLDLGFHIPEKEADR